MTNDPIRQADIERRLANLAKAPRCGARTRMGSPCRQAAVKERTRCRMHQTVEVQHVHLHSGAQGVVGIVNAAGEREGNG